VATLSTNCNETKYELVAHRQTGYITHIHAQINRYCTTGGTLDKNKILHHLWHSRQKHESYSLLSLPLRGARVLCACTIAALHNYKFTGDRGGVRPAHCLNPVALFGCRPAASALVAAFPFIFGSGETDADVHACNAMKNIGFSTWNVT
jgi:hypothetical protein